ncbi:MAG: hypothetical protein ACOX5D_08970, partial [Limnochordia bacterium]
MEYAHTHPMFNHRLTHRLGESFLVTGPEHAFLLPEMLAYGGMRKTKALGAQYCFGGVPEFYGALGFETIGHPPPMR